MQAMTHYDWDTRVGSEEIEFRYTMRSPNLVFSAASRKWRAGVRRLRPDRR